MIFQAPIDLQVEGRKAQAIIDLHTADDDRWTILESIVYS